MCDTVMMVAEVFETNRWIAINGETHFIGVRFSVCYTNVNIPQFAYMEEVIWKCCVNNDNSYNVYIILYYIILYYYIYLMEPPSCMCQSLTETSLCGAYLCNAIDFFVIGQFEFRTDVFMSLVQYLYPIWRECLWQYSSWHNGRSSLRMSLYSVQTTRLSTTG